MTEEEAAEREAERRAEDREERRTRSWVERGERWAESVVYGRD